MTAPLKTIEGTADLAGLMHRIGRAAQAAARVLALAPTATVKLSWSEDASV